nr:hypothetical protein Iba_chr03bCG10640 [Ipomoea batatas]
MVVGSIGVTRWKQTVAVVAGFCRRYGGGKKLMNAEEGGGGGGGDMEAARRWCAELGFLRSLLLGLYMDLLYWDELRFLLGLSGRFYKYLGLNRLFAKSLRPQQSQGHRGQLLCYGLRSTLQAGFGPMLIIS